MEKENKYFTGVKQEQLFQLYKECLVKKGKTVSGNEELALHKMAYSLNDQDAAGMVQKLIEADSYTLDDTISLMEELLDAYKDYDFGKETTVEINGNQFVYDPDQVDINSIEETLYRIGNEHKGETWSVDFDDDGLLLIW